MAVDLKLTPIASADVDDAYTWYESCRIGLGEEFLTSLQDCLDGIRMNPLMYPLVWAGFRRGLLRRFPYVVFFEADPAGVRVHAVLHGAQHREKHLARVH